MHMRHTVKPRKTTRWALNARAKYAAALVLMSLLVVISKRQHGPAELPVGGVAVEAVGGRRQLGKAALSDASLVAAAGGGEASDLLALAAVPAGAGIWGFVEKAGPLDLRHWHANHSEWRQAQRQIWVEDRWRVTSTKSSSPPPQLPLLSPCQVFVNHLYKVVYLRHAKTASSSLLCHFSGCRAPPGAEAAGTAQLDTSFQPLEMLSEEAIEQLWRDYFVVTFVRNPYQRVVSSYRMMARQLARDGALAASFSWPRFSADPAAFADDCEADPRCQTKGREFVYTHINPQQPCVVSANGGWAADFIGRVEHLDEDLAAVLAELEKRRPAAAPPIKPLQQSLENVNGRPCNETGVKHTVAREQYCEPVQYYTGQHAASFLAIQQQYGADIQAFKFGAGGGGLAAGAAASGAADGNGGSSAAATRWHAR